MNKDQQLAAYVKLCRQAVEDGKVSSTASVQQLRQAAELLELAKKTRWGITDLAEFVGSDRKVTSIAKDVYEEYMS